MYALLIKAATFKHTAGFALYGNPPRWHKLGPKKHAPKGAPVAAHPQAAGQYVPAKHFTDEQWERLHLSPENTNAETHKNKLAQIKHMAESGDVTGLLGMPLGTNLYGKQLAAVINHLLGLYGSPHKVVAGQKAGEHPAVKPSGAAQPTEAGHVEGDKYVMPLDAAIEEHKDLVHAAETPTKADDKAELAEQKAELAQMEAAKGHAAPAAAAEPAPASSKLSRIPWDKMLTTSEKNGNHNAHVAKIKAMAYAGDVAGLEDYIAKKGDPKQLYAKKQKLLAQTALAALKEGDAPSPAAPPAPAKEEDAPPAPVASPSVASTPAEPPPPAAPDIGDLTAEQLGKLQSIPWFKQKLGPEKSNAKSHNLAVDKIEAMAFAGDKAGLQAFIAGKAGAKQHYANKQAVLAQTALAALQEGEAAAPEAKPKQTVKLNPWPSSTFVKEGDGEWKQVDDADGKQYPVTAGVQSALYMHQGLPVPADISSSLSPDLKQKIIRQASKEFGKPKEYLQALMEGNSPPKPKRVVLAKKPKAPDTGPKEGDIKQGAEGLLVLKNGHWVKVGEDQKAPAVDAKVAAQNVPMPKLESGTGKLKFAKTMKLLKEIAAVDGAEGLSKVVKITPSGHVKIAGYKTINPSGSVYGKNAELMAQYAKALHEAVVGTNAVGSGAPAQQPAPAAPSGVESMDNWVQTGPQAGSNPGGRFKDAEGFEWYCKFPKDDDIAKSEVLAANLYGLAGVTGPDAKLVSKGGKLGVASRWEDVKKASSPAALAAVDGVKSGFAVDAWLGNWDVVGMGLDNLQIGADGNAIRVDAGGSLEYRAQGGKKAFGNVVTEIDSLRDKHVNPQAAAVFGDMTTADITASVARVLKLSDTAIRAMVNQFGPGDAQAKSQLAATLIARRNDLAAKFPKAVKAKKKPVFDPGKLGLPPSFLNWGGSGKSGPSSKEFLNQANEDAVQAIYAAAKTGNSDAVKALKAKVYDKNTGQVTGEAPVLEHPSQHVKGYAQQALNEIDYQLNPPKRFRFDGGHPLMALHKAYPPHPGVQASPTIQKIGKFLMLGEPGKINLADLGLPQKTTHKEAGGSMSKATFAAQAKSAFAKMPKTQKQAIQSYTGSQYHEINHSLWSGNPSGAAKSAGEALLTLGHEIPAGTILSRKISVKGADLDMLLKSVGKVLLEPAVMSTSIRPSSWSGNVHLKLHVGPGVKGLWVGSGSDPSGGAVSNHPGEDEVILPPGMRLVVLGVKKGGDPDGFGKEGQHIIEAVLLPSV